MSRFVVGIDLGTSNSALAYADTQGKTDEAQPTVVPFAVPQVVSAGFVDKRPTLPSALYVSSGDELPEGALNLPWKAENRFTLGHFAREQGAKIATRFVHSSKSWLCHGGVDREDKILPPNSPDKDAKMAPTEVASMVLNHLREAWNDDIAKGDPSLDLAEQEITLCVPASFDAGARNLTVTAAERAGFKNLHLLEEPQAAIYSWIQSTGEDWRKLVTKGDLVLVVDVGGGTSDFSLIAVTEEEGELQLRRVAVGDHILLGGDNMDLALAHGLAQRLKHEQNKKLDAWQMSSLVQQCRMAKEALLSEPERMEYPITILGRSSSVIGGSIKTRLPREGLDSLLLDGFFPQCEPNEEPAQPRLTGFREAGLPYAADPGITRHLAKFLRDHADLLDESSPERKPDDGMPIIPSVVLFNGGVFEAELLQQRVMETLAHWADLAEFERPRSLGQPQLDLAVASGAAYLGLARRGKGIRIRGGSPRSYYIGFESAQPAIPGFVPPLNAMCVVPFGMEEGTSLDISGEEIDLCIYTGEPGAFRFLSSTKRKGDRPGEILQVDEDELSEHSPVETTLGDRQGEIAEVDLRSTFTDIGVLQLACVNRKNRENYQLEFNVRQAEAG